MTILITDNPNIALNDHLMAKQMAEALHAAYPNWLWGVTCSGQTGMADIRNLYLSAKYGFRLHLRSIYSASEWKREVLRAGGEILERFKADRVFTDDKYSSMATDFAGRIKGDYSK